jgi:hypothetical protein
MSRKHYMQVGLLLMLVAVVAQAVWLVSGQAGVVASVASSGPAPAAATGGGSGPGGIAADAPTKDAGNGITVGYSYHNDVSAALRDVPANPPTPHSRAAEHENPSIQTGSVKDAPDTVVQRSFGSNASIAAPATSSSFDGMSDTSAACNCAPPDTNGEPGATQYVQSVNSAFQVFDKSTGASVYGPAQINTLWKGFGGACEANNDGDPIVLYDQLAGRWLVSQFTASSPYDECVAVSTTSDATGTWNRYAFQLSTTDFPDYPKLGVWPDGYYMSVNWYSGGRSYAGPRPFALNRSAMLNGTTASFQTLSAPLGSSQPPIHPADLDGSTLPASGAPGLFAQFGNPLKLYKFSVNWSTPSATTWTNSASLSVAGFTQLCTTTRSCVPQPGTSSGLDGIGDRLMNRVVYRNMGTYETLLVNHTVSVGTSKNATQAAVRWYEVRNPEGAATLFQQGTFAPDSTSRWMGSVAMDKQGNIALGYSASSSSVYPTIRFTGHLAGDAAGQMTQGEGTLLAGISTGAQARTGNRWGDYSDMTVDPSNDCTFWYTTEYYPPGVSQFNWKTRIGSFTLGTCTSLP